MYKLIYIKSLLLISTLTTINLPDLSSAIAKQPTKQSIIGNTSISQSKEKKEELLSDLACKIIHRRGECDKGKGSRDPSVCSIFPYSYAKKPGINPALGKTVRVRLFAWKSATNVTVEKIEIKRYGTNDLDSSFKWIHDVKDNEQKEQRVKYVGSAFKPGKYIYKLTYKKSLNGSMKTYTSKIKFRVIEDKDNSFISIMKKFEDKHGRNLNDENIVMEKAKLLIDRKLVSDAVQEILLAKNNSLEWNTAANKFRTKFCPTSK